MVHGKSHCEKMDLPSNDFMSVCPEWGSTRLGVFDQEYPMCVTPPTSLPTMTLPPAMSDIQWPKSDYHSSCYNEPTGDTEFLMPIELTTGCDRWFAECQSNIDRLNKLEKTLRALDKQ